MRKMNSLSLGILVSAAGGLVMTLALPADISWLGVTLLALPLGLTAIVIQKGPLRRVSLSEPTDEREESWRDRANLNAFGTVSIVAMIGVGSFAMWMMFQFLAGRTVPPLYIGMVLFAFTMFLFTLFQILPNLIAGWSMPSLVEDEPEEERRLSFLKPGRR